MFTFNSKEDLSTFVQNEILSSSEAAVILGNISRNRMKDHIKNGHITPIRSNPYLFLKQDILDYLPELEANRVKYGSN